jgi:hypothetical protein
MRYNSATEAACRGIKTVESLSLTPADFPTKRIKLPVWNPDALQFVPTIRDIEANHADTLIGGGRAELVAA